MNTIIAYYYCPCHTNLLYSYPIPLSFQDFRLSKVHVCIIGLGILRISVPTEKHGVVISPVLATLTRSFLPIPSSLSLVNILHHAVEPSLADCSVEPQVIRRAIIPTTSVPQSLQLISLRQGRSTKCFLTLSRRSGCWVWRRSRSAGRREVSEKESGRTSGTRGQKVTGPWWPTTSPFTMLLVHCTLGWNKSPSSSVC